jgi:hypothetical protein
MSDKINVLSYSDYEKSVCDMGEGDRRIFQFLKSFGKPGGELPTMNEVVLLPTAHSGERVLNEMVEPVGVNTYAYLATMKSLTGSAYNSKYE